MQDFAWFQTRIEGQDLQRFAKGTSSAKNFTFSFYVKANSARTMVAELLMQIIVGMLAEHLQQLQIGHVSKLTLEQIPQVHLMMITISVYMLPFG